jgi:hypothetical protein
VGKELGSERQTWLRAGAIASALFLAACTAQHASQVVQVSGQVLNSKTTHPVQGIHVTAGANDVVTAADGRFTIATMPGSSVSFSGCAYAPLSLNAPNTDGTLDAKLRPIAVSAKVSSNLTHTGIEAEITGHAKARTGKTGRVTVYGLCPGDKVHVASKGYDDASVTTPHSRRMSISLVADPETTAKQEVAWEAAQDWALSCSLLHPDSRSYISEAQCQQMLATYAREGYQDVSIDVKSVTYIRWTYSKCTLSSFGPKTYPHTAAVNYTLQESTPSGGVSRVSGIEHWVQSTDRTWRWFPTEGCDYPFP